MLLSTVFCIDCWFCSQLAFSVFLTSPSQLLINWPLFFFSLFFNILVKFFNQDLYLFLFLEHVLVKIYFTSMLWFEWLARKSQRRIEICFGSHPTCSYLIDSCMCMVMQCSNRTRGGWRATPIDRRGGAARTGEKAGKEAQAKSSMRRCPYDVFLLLVWILVVTVSEYAQCSWCCQ